MTSTVKWRSLLASSNSAGRTRMRRSRPRSKATAYSSPSGAGQPAITVLAVELCRDETEQGAVSLEHLAVDLVVLDDDAEAVLDFGQQAGDGHRIELGQMAEQAGLGGEFGDTIWR